MLQSLLNSLFGCSHRRTTFPLTPVRKSAGFQAPGGARNGTYVTCLDCGKELAYNRTQPRCRNAAELSVESVSLSDAAQDYFALCTRRRR